VIFKFLERGNIETASSKASYDRAQVDSLTGIYNKGALLEQGKEIFERARMTETPLALMMFDLDNFKKVNDTYGHPTGDYVLKELSAVINNQLRKGDFFARYGGEEFCIVLVGSDLRKGMDTAERIRQVIENHKFMDNDIRLEVTISVGVAVLEESMSDFEGFNQKSR
jgi:two-component system cell cycle response regulator